MLFGRVFFFDLLQHGLVRLSKVRHRIRSGRARVARLRRVLVVLFQLFFAPLLLRLGAGFVLGVQQVAETGGIRE